jgi:hypothetical protein
MQSNVIILDVLRILEFNFDAINAGGWFCKDHFHSNGCSTCGTESNNICNQCYDNNYQAIFGSAYCPTCSPKVGGEVATIMGKCYDGCYDYLSDFKCSVERMRKHIKMG